IAVAAIDHHAGRLHLAQRSPQALWTTAEDLRLAVRMAFKLYPAAFGGLEGMLRIGAQGRFVPILENTATAQPCLGFVAIDPMVAPGTSALGFFVVVVQAEGAGHRFQGD